MALSPILVICLMLGSVLLVVGLFRPFLGMLVFLVIHFVQPGELVPALDPLRIELVYGTLLAGVLIYRRVTIPGHSLFSDKILMSTVLLIGAGLLSVPFSVWRGGAANTVIDMIKLVTLLFLLTLMVDSETRLRMTLWCMAAMATWFAGSGLSAYAQGQFYALGKLNRAEGVNSLAGNPNQLAGLLLALLPLLIALFRSTRNIFARILLLTCGGLSLVAISLTGARIVAIALIALAVFYTLQSKHKFSTFLGCVLIACLIWHWLPVEYKQRYLTVEQYAQGGELDASNELRLEIWRAGGQIFLKYPIFGVGAGQFPTAYGMIILAGRHAGWMNPHNLLIQVACELGIIGLIVFGNFLWQIIKGMADVIRKKRIRGIELNHQVAIACAAMFVGIVILSIVSHTLYGPYWYVLGGLVAANRNILRAKLQRRAKLQVAVNGVSDSLPKEEQDVSLVGAPTSAALFWFQRNDTDEC
jgi:putative inorganic carbon (HCO3(-)) transporter